LAFSTDGRGAERCAKQQVFKADKNILTRTENRLLTEVGLR